MSPKISPKDLIGRPPYKACPECKKVSFGILLNLGDEKSYFKKCHECFYEEYIEIPKLNKKLIYLDQFVLSFFSKLSSKNMVDDPQMDNFKSLYEKLHRLIVMNLAVCPNSNIHFDESIVHGDQRDFIKLYTYLSAGVTLTDTDIVRRLQIIDNFKQWLNKEDYIFQVKKESVAIGNLENWTSPTINSVSGDFSLWAAEAEEKKNRYGKSLDAAFNHWKSSEVSAEKSYENELKGFGIAIYKNFFNYISQDISISSPENIISQQILIEFQKKKISRTNMLDKLKEYAASNYYYKIPYLKISSQIISILTHRSHLRTNLYKHSMVNDIQVISCYLPYLDAIFVDREMGIILDEVKKKYGDDFPYSTQIFSVRNLEAFSSYIENIENTVDDKHLAVIEDRYNFELLDLEQRKNGFGFFMDGLKPRTWPAMLPK